MPFKFSDYAPDQPRFYLWDTPPQDHPLWSNPAAFPLIRFIVGPSTTTEQVVAGVRNAAIAAGADRASGFPLFIQNSTTGKWGPSGPQSSGLDALVSPSPHTPVPAQASMFNENGIAVVRARMLEWFEAIKNDFNARGIPLPTFMNWDDEEVIGFGSGNAFVTNTIVGRTDAVNSDTGAWFPSLSDSRASTEIICPGENEGDNDLTLLDWESLRTAGGIPVTTNQYPFVGNNATFRRWLARYSQYSWILNQCLYQPARMIFGVGTETGNYNDAASAAPGIPDSFNPTFPTNYRRNFGSVHCPVLYAPNRTNLALSSYADYPDDPEREHIELALACRAAIAAAPGLERFKPVVAWYQKPGATLSWTTFTPGVSTQARLVSLMANQYGDSRFNLWGTTTQFDETQEMIGEVYNQVRRVTVRRPLPDRPI